MRYAFPLLMACMIGVGIGVGGRWHPTASQAQQQDSKPLDVSRTPPKPYGLQGDGQADDTEALQQAVNAGSVWLPRGVYRLTRPIVVDLNKTGYVGILGDGTAQIRMTAAGPAFRIVGTHSGTAQPQTVKPEVWQRQRTPMIDGIEIVGEHPQADGIEVAGTMQFTLTRCVIRQCRHGVHLVQRNRNVLISACHIYQNRGVGIYLDEVNLHQINIDGCHISYCLRGGIVSRGGEVRNLQIGTCDIESNMSKDGPATANILIDCTDGSLAEATISGCTIQHNDYGPESANIRILGLGKALREGQARWGHVTITGNVLSDVQHNIDIDNARGVTIVGNTFWMAYENNLRITDSEQIVIGANIMERNPAYNYGTSLKCKNAVLLQSCRDCTISALQIHNVYDVPAAIRLEKCRRMNLTGLSILDTECIGILWIDVQDSRLSDCIIQPKIRANAQEPKWPAIEVRGGAGNSIVDNLTNGVTWIPPTSLRER